MEIPYSKSGDKEQDEKLLKPYTHILQVPGKQIRAKLAHAFNIWLKIPDDMLYNVGDIVNIVHNSSLLLDDIQDRSILRRGIPVAHSIYGDASTINAANYVVAIALERVHDFGHADGTRIYTEQLLELFRGQGMEIYWRDNFTCPSEEEYRQMTIRNILRQRTKDREIKKYCVSLLEKFGSFEYTRRTLAQLDREARDELQRLGGNVLLEQLLNSLLNWQCYDHPHFESE